MAKEGKSLTADEAKAKLTSAKEKQIVAKDAIAAFCKENGLKKSEDHSKHEDAKIAAKYVKLKEALDEKTARVEKYTTMVKSAKKSSSPAKAKYNYPKEVKTSLDKKKFRTDTRNKAKKAGVTVDQYLADPEKYAKLIEKKAPAKKAKTEEAAPKKKKKAAAAEAEAPVKKKKKKAVAETPAAEAED